MAVRDPGGCRRQSGPQKSNSVPELPAAVSGNSPAPCKSF